jgi:predicted Zn-dependent peptidase
MQTVERDVPLDTLYKVYHMCDRLHEDYYATDLISDVLSNGKSARLVQRLVKEKALFSNLNAYITGDIDAGLFMVVGTLNKGISFEEAEQAIEVELDLMKHEAVEAKELEKVVNKLEASLVFGEINILNKAMNLAYFELLGDASMINDESEKYRKVTPKKIQDVATELFRKENCSTLYYKAKN